jgi:hypothetical protein
MEPFTLFLVASVALTFTAFGVKVLCSVFHCCAAHRSVQQHRHVDEYTSIPYYYIAGSTPAACAETTPFLLAQPLCYSSAQDCGIAAAE